MVHELPDNVSRRRLPCSFSGRIHTEAFDIDLAEAFMWMSQAAYETTADTSEPREPRKLERILAQWGFACRARLSRAGI
jgi:hypothetical protein